jgi:hypothetical protein
MSLVQQTLTKIVYLQKIISYACTTSLELLNYELVHSSWHECVREYSDESWSKIHDQYRSDSGKTLLHLCVKKGAIEMLKLFLRIGVDVP